jgi:GGDEF domain-containing protein
MAPLAQPLVARFVPGRAQSACDGPTVVQHYGGMYFAIVFAEDDRLEAIELAKVGAVPAFEASRAA